MRMAELIINDKYVLDFNAIIAICETGPHVMSGPPELWRDQMDCQSFSDHYSVKGLPAEKGAYRCKVRISWDTGEDPDQHIEISDVAPLLTGIGVTP